MLKATENDHFLRLGALDDNLTNDFIRGATKLARETHDYWADIYQKAREDLQFLSDEEGAQWDQKAYAARINSGRPALTVDQLTQFVNQVSNNVRANTPTINVIPSDQHSSKEVAGIYKGRIKDIEYNSNADDAYDNAANSSIRCSIGFIRVDHDWAGDQSFDQQITINRVVNPFSVLLDPASVEPDGSDAMYCFIFDELSEKEFKKQYGDADPISFATEDTSRHYDKDKGCVKIAEYFKVELVPIEIGLLPDGTVEEVQDGVQYARVRRTSKRVVRRYIMSGAQILKEGVFPGEYVPVVPVYGEEAWQGGVRKLNSLIRKAKDPQRLYNYWKTMEAEMLQRAPKSVAIAPFGTTEDFADDWKYPEKAAVLRYTAKQAPNGQFLPAPNLTNPPPIPSGYVNAAQAASNDIKSTMGLYNAFLGDRSNETSGVAINARKVEGDRAVYHFGDNLVRSITQVGRVIVSMLPVVDDTPKIVSVIGEDGEQKSVGINGALADGQEQSYYLGRGKYSVRVTTGSSLMTMRQEFALVMRDIIDKNPELLRVFGDVFMENQDFPGAQAVAKRLKYILLPEVRRAMGEDNHDPQAAAMAQENEQLKAMMQQMQAEIQSKQADLLVKQQEIQLKQQEAQSDSQNERAKNELALRSLLLEEQRLIAEINNNQMQMELKARELALKEAELMAQAQTADVVVQPQQGPLGGAGA